MARLHHTYAIMRNLLLLLSSILILSGLVLLGMGVWIMYGAATFVQVMGSFSVHLVTLSYICIGVGGVLALLGTVGYLGAKKENRCLILLYFSVVTTLFIAELMGTITVLFYKDLVEFTIREASKKTLMTAYIGPASTDPISSAWNSVMIKNKCCGFDNSTEDFKNSVFSTNTGLLYPKACCVNMKDPTCDGLTIEEGLLHQASCLSKLVTVIKEQSVIIGSTAAVICIMELVSMIVSVVLFVRLGNVYY
ncbi:tetraspanin-16-like [Hypomesus transpacificus]|uniref:tetraspanin-16-like n=1 Tax=Hypomesus transpacificus TaxID=137520 RepID=UPI001F081DF5|nr:tetraspanin-16-like [Hypomesus transpacificus]